MSDDQADLALRHRLKRELRKRRRQVRHAMPATAIEARSAKIVERVLALPEWDSATTIMAFVSLPGEVQLAPLVEAAWDAGKTVATSAMTDDFQDIEPRRWDRGAELEESGKGFEQPLRSAPAVVREAVDLVVVPALAIDGEGHRLGYGGGFYDRLLPSLTRGTRVGVIFDFELMTELPRQPWDVPVHAVVTDEQQFRLDAPA